ncbi:MAG: type IV secretion system DNA-binding domain-containing protein [Eubacterium sp.]|nr:type IV secretion system DNA-binding domain-containing protein [Eubacterium sp.]
MAKKQKDEKSSSKKNDRVIGYSENLINFIEFGDFKDRCLEVKYNYQKKKSLLLIMRISGIDIFHFTESDISSVCNNFANATNALRCEYRYVFTSRPVNLSAQRSFLNHKINSTADPFRKKMLQRKLNELDYAESNYRERLSYLILFGDNSVQLNKQAELYISAMRDTNIEFCDLQETCKVLASIMRRRDVDAKGVNDILPDKIVLAQNHINIDGLYSTVMVLNGYPADLQNLKLAQIISRLDDVDITFDVLKKHKRDAQHEIEKSIDELQTRHITNRKTKDFLDTDTEKEKLIYIRQAIANDKEQMLYLTIRVIVTRDSVEKLSDAVENIALELSDDGIECFIPFNTMREEYIDFLRSSNPIETPFPLYDTFSLQFPFYFQSHLDENSMLFGTSITGGLISLDFFKRTAYRASYDIMLAGAKGSGKSVTLKSMIQDQLLLSNKVLCIDLEGEYDDLAHIYNGQIIRMNKNSLINPLEIRQVLSTAADEDADRETNFASELSRIITFFYYFIPTITEFEADVLTDLVMDTFRTHSIDPSTDIERLSPSDFPTLSELLESLRKQLYTNEKSVNNELSENRVNALERLEVSLKVLCEGSYSSMFNGITNIDIADSDFIVFNVKDLSQMEQRVYDAQLFNILSLMWRETALNVEHNRNIFSQWDRRKITSVIDEAHKFISSDSAQVTAFIETLTRRARKYEAGLLFATQSITDFNPPKTEKEGEAANKVRTIFGLVQYKIILKHSNEKLSALIESFPQFTQSELTGTSDFASGEMLVSLGTGRYKFHCRKNVDALDLMYIGNSEDRMNIAHDIFRSLYQDDLSVYANILRSNNDNVIHFCNVFAEEMMNELGGFVRSDSEALYSICHNAAENIANELLLRSDW